MERGSGSGEVAVSMWLVKALVIAMHSRPVNEVRCVVRGVDWVEMRLFGDGRV